MTSPVSGSSPAAAPVEDGPAPPSDPPRDETPQGAAGPAGNDAPADGPAPATPPTDPPAAPPPTDDSSAPPPSDPPATPPTDRPSAPPPTDRSSTPPAEATSDPPARAPPRARHAPVTARLGTGCAALDVLLDGGLEQDAVTLVFGEGGSGKTNLAIECARESAAAGARVAFVDTEGVSADRLRQVFGDEGLDRLLFFTPFDFREQEQMVQRSTLVKDLGLVVVDSINMHYRLHIDGGDEAEREAARSLYKQLHHLTGFARRQNVPVLVTGQVFGIEDTTQPFARRTMEHLVKAAVRFEKRPDGTRRATVVKHRSIPEGRQALFRIGAHGLESLAPPSPP